MQNVSEDIQSQDMCAFLRKNSRRYSISPKHYASLNNFNISVGLLKQRNLCKLFYSLTLIKPNSLCTGLNLIRKLVLNKADDDRSLKKGQKYINSQCLTSDTVSKRKPLQACTMVFGLKQI